MCDGLGRVSKEVIRLMYMYLRDKFILKAAQEQNGHLFNLGQPILTLPGLVAKASKVASGRNESRDMLAFSFHHIDDVE